MSRSIPPLADAIARAAIAGQPVPPWFVDPAPLPGAPYDLVVGDLFYSQLLYPALLDAGAGDALSETVGPPLTRAVVARLHASAPAVLHVHDPLAWWAGHPQPVTLAQVLCARPREAQRLIAQGRGPHAWDPRAALAGLGLPVTATA